MKKIKYIACLLSLAVVSGCDSILDKGPLDSFTNDNFWTGEGNISGYANAFYEQFLGYGNGNGYGDFYFCLLYTSPSPRDTERSRMPSSA